MEVKRLKLKSTKPRNKLKLLLCLANLFAFFPIIIILAIYIEEVKLMQFSGHSVFQLQIWEAYFACLLKCAEYNFDDNIFPPVLL